MRKLRAEGAPLRAIAEKAVGVSISHVGVKKALLATADRQTSA
jgi:hypothetical protein